MSPCGGGPRLTLHQYFGRLSNPPNIGWALLPRRLAESEDEGLRRFCGNLTRVQEGYARSGYDLRKCAESPELLEHLSTDDATAVDRNAGRAFLAEHSPEHFHAGLELSAAEAAAVDQVIPTPLHGPKHRFSGLANSGCWERMGAARQWLRGVARCDRA